MKNQVSNLKNVLFVMAISSLKLRLPRSFHSLAMTDLAGSLLYVLRSKGELFDGKEDPLTIDCRTFKQGDR